MGELIIGATDSITLLTGKPGAGKTQRVVKFCKQAVDRGEVLFVCNLNGLQLPHITCEDPRQWRDLPAGSVLVVDEAQNFFRTRRGGEAPEYITAMETIRHYGVRLILTTQNPEYLDTHLRGLVGLHEHLVRENGKQAARIFRHSEVMENVRSDKARSRYDSEVWAYEPELFDLYKSAEVHTFKRKFSARGKRGAIMLAIVAVAVVGFVWRVLGPGLTGHAHAEGTAQEVAATLPAGREAQRPGSPGPFGGDNLAKHVPEAKAQYLAAFRPRIPEMPWSAPAYDGRAVKAEPEVFCATFGAGLDAQGEYTEASCACLTEQATRYELPEALCRALAKRGGAYNPFREPDADAPPEPPQDAQGAHTGQVAAFGVGEADFRGQQARYGQMRSAPIPADYEGSRIH